MLTIHPQNIQAKSKDSPPQNEKLYKSTKSSKLTKVQNNNFLLEVLKTLLGFLRSVAGSLSTSSDKCLTHEIWRLIWPILALEMRRMKLGIPAEKIQYFSQSLC